MSKHPRAMRIKPSWGRDLKFKTRNFISGQIYRLKFNAALWLRVQARRRKAAAIDPVWKESWWCLEKRYTKLAKRYTKMELRYMKARDEIRKLRRHGNR